jgi:hypothetical protein
LRLVGANAAQLGLWGAAADKAQVQQVSDYYQQQQVRALQQRTADRAQVIAQEPQLFQQALEAQRQDNYQTQNRIDTMIGQAQDWISNRMSLRLQTAQAGWQAGLASMAATHVNPWTGEVQAGYTRLKDGSIVDTKSALQAGHWTTQDQNYQKRTAAMQQHNQDYFTLGEDRIKAAQTKASQGGNFNSGLSKALGVAVDGKGHPILVNGKMVQMPKSTTGASKPLSQKDVLNFAGGMGAYARNLFNGAAATTKSAAIPKSTLDQAIGIFMTNGYFQNAQLRPYAFQALANAYGVTTADIQNAAQGAQTGINQATGGAYEGWGVTPVYGPAAPAGVTSMASLTPAQRAQATAAIAQMNRSAGTTIQATPANILKAAQRLYSASGLQGAANYAGSVASNILNPGMFGL